jgi:hypothetical protein
MLMAFTFTFYIMFNESDQHHLLVNAIYPEYWTIFKSMISTYQMGVLGDFEMDNFWEQEDEIFMISLFLVLTFMVQIVLLNLLVRSSSNVLPRPFYAVVHVAAQSFDAACVYTDCTDGLDI